MRYETVKALLAGIKAKHDEDMAELARIQQRRMWREATYFELTGERLIQPKEIEKADEMIAKIQVSYLKHVYDAGIAKLKSGR